MFGLFVLLTRTMINLVTLYLKAQREQTSFSIILSSNSMNSLNWVYSDVSLK